MTRKYVNAYFEQGEAALGALRHIAEHGGKSWAQMMADTFSLYHGDSKLETSPPWGRSDQLVWSGSLDGVPGRICVHTNVQKGYVALTLDLLN